METITTESIAAFAQQLLIRWQDEKEYEDFQDYKDALQKRLPVGSTLTGFTRKPWKADFTLADGTRKWVKATLGGYQWGGYR